MSLTHLLQIVLLVICTALTACNALPSTILRKVDLGYAQYQSDLSLEDGVTSFLGIRYAAPPTGQLRWRKPQAPATIPGIQNATTEPTQCFQQFLEGAMGASPANPFRNSNETSAKRSLKENKGSKDTQIAKRDDVGVSSEDCLFLNVHVPTSPTSASLLPVIVYIHGGGYDAGNVSLYPVNDFVKQSKLGLVAVSVQYRLGLFGFLSGGEIKEKGDLNSGLLDQNFALQWVQAHIDKFGGDPSKVTIWGQSAGAGSVLQHIVAHAGNTQPPLFRAAMMNSPFLPFQYAYNDPIPEALYTEVVSQVGCAGSKDTLSCIRTVSASALLAADTKIGLASFFGTYAFVPVVDGSFIVERPTVTLARKHVNGKALLVSSNADEGALFTPIDQLVSNNFTLSQYVTQLFPRLSQEQVQQVVQVYSRTGRTVPDQATAVMGDSIFVCPAYYTVSAFGSNGFKAMFALPPAFHAEDLSYDFSNFGLPATFLNVNFSVSWQHSFLDTALSLTPNAHFDSNNITPKWPTWSENRQEMLFNKTDTDVPVIRTMTTLPQTISNCNLWAGLSQVISQ